MTIESARERILGRRAVGAYWPLLDRVAARVASVSYPFVDSDDFLSLSTIDPREGMQIYWREILFRAHSASSVSILRNQRWLDGAALALESTNFFALAACLRSLIEAAGDTSDALSQVPLTLATKVEPIRLGLANALRQFVVNKELEDKLIHFSHARRVSRTESAPNSHRKKNSSDYVAEFGFFGFDAVVEFYAELCEYVHPAASSVNVFLEASSEEEICISPAREREVVQSLANRLPQLMEPVAMLAFSAPLVTLGVLNALPIENLHTPEVRPEICRGIPLWNKVEAALGRGDQTH